MTDILSEGRIERLQAEWSRVSGEMVEVDQISGAIYAYGSEIAVLRLWAYWNKEVRNKSTRYYYSESMKTWCFSKEL